MEVAIWVEQFVAFATAWIMHILSLLTNSQKTKDAFQHFLRVLAAKTETTVRQLFPHVFTTTNSAELDLFLGVCLLFGWLFLFAASVRTWIFHSSSWKNLAKSFSKESFCLCFMTWCCFFRCYEIRILIRDENA